jgi:predicted lipid-binding transport protein (Tim44 family)
MKRFAIALFAVVMGVGAMIPDAEAKRLGGGQSSGVSRDSSVMKRDAVPAKPAAAPAQAAAPAAAPSGMSRWMGPLAGLAAGVGLAALFSHLGMGEGMASMMMLLAIAMVAVFAFRWLMRKRQSAGALQPAMQYAGMPAGLPPAQPADALMPAQPAGTPAAGAAAAHIPADFDVDGFLRQAKLNFIRLQAANDRGDMEDIRQFCTPEMVAEIQMQLQERNQLAQQTDVMQLNAELLDVSSENDRGIASVRFSGQLSEAANAAPEAFSEVWHLTKPLTGNQGWRVAGIQQS